MTKKTYPALDWFRMVSAFLVVAIHTGVLSSFSETADFFLTGVLSRVAVPFFFMVSGFFLMPKIARRLGAVLKIERKFLLLYGAAILLYLPLNFYAKQYFFADVPSLLRALFLDGTFYHLWYFPAIAEGLLLLSILQCFFSKKSCMIICIFLYLIGLGGDSYYGIASAFEPFDSFYEAYFQIGAYTRNGLFFAPVFLCLGWIVSERTYQLPKTEARMLTVISLCLLWIEGGLLHMFQLQRHDSMYFFLLPCMYGIFCVLLNTSLPEKPVFRKTSMWIYLIHPWVIVIVRAFAGVFHLEALFVEQSFLHYLLVSVISYSLAVVLWKIQKKFQQKQALFHFGPGQK